MSSSPTPEKRSSWMLAVGVFHIVFGTVGLIASVVMVLGGILVIVFLMDGPTVDIPTAIRDVVFPADEPLYAWGTAASTLVLGFGRLMASLLLILAGVRVIDVSPAGRKLSIIAIVSWTILNVAEMYARHHSIVWFLAMSVYPTIIEVLFMQRRWRAAFS